MTKVGLHFALLVGAFAFFPQHLSAVSEQHILKAEVVTVVDEERTIVPGTQTETTVQTLVVKLLTGENAGRVLSIENDFIPLDEGNTFYLKQTTEDGADPTYTVLERDRHVEIIVLVALFAFAVVAFGGMQGVRSLLSLAGSLFIIIYLLLPSLMSGYPPLLVSTLFAAAILFVAIYFTHGFTREATGAFAGTISAVLITGALAFFSVWFMRPTGFDTEEAVFLNLQSAGQLNFNGLLLGGMIIGVLGILDDIAITQAAVVSEIYRSAGDLKKKQVYGKAIRVGREHVAALVNTLALAYTGASLPLLLIFSVSDYPLGLILSQELFSTEIVRTIVGSIGLLFTVPITTMLAVYFLQNSASSKTSPHVHIH